jgi:hypothetical protein
MRQLDGYEIDPVFGCHLWTGSLNDNDRPIVWHGNKPFSAIRKAFEQAGIEIPDDRVPDHLCRRIRCVSLEHLELVTKQENERRKSMRYRLTRRVCRRGHPLNETTRMLTPEGGVLCRMCIAIHGRGGGAGPMGAGTHNQGSGQTPR